MQSCALHILFTWLDGMPKELRPVRAAVAHSLCNMFQSLSPQRPHSDTHIRVRDDLHLAELTHILRSCVLYPGIVLKWERASMKINRQIRVWPRRPSTASAAYMEVTQQACSHSMDQSRVGCLCGNFGWNSKLASPFWRIFLPTKQQSACTSSSYNCSR